MTRQTSVIASMAATSGGKVIDDQAIEDLRASILGEVFTPADAGYDGARAVWNAMIDRRPSVIIRSNGTPSWRRAQRRWARGRRRGRDDRPVGHARRAGGP